jgi:hypothetical protein
MTAFADTLCYAPDGRILGFRSKPSIRFGFENGPTDWALIATARGMFDVTPGAGGALRGLSTSRAGNTS